MVPADPGPFDERLRVSEGFKNELCPTLLFAVEVVGYAFVLLYHPIVVRERPDHHRFHQ